MRTQENNYVTPTAKAVKINALAIICQSGLTGSQNEEYQMGSTEGWF